MDNNQVTEKKKKRGFNVIDVIFILVVLAAIAVVVWKFAGNTAAKENLVTYTITFHTDDMPADAADALKKDAAVMDENGENTIGTITDVTLGAAKVYTTTADGKCVTSDKPGYKSADITATCEAADNDNFVLIGGEKYSVNHSFTARFGMVKAYVRITGIQNSSEK